MSLYRRFVMAVQVVVPFSVFVTALTSGALIYVSVLTVKQYILFTLPQGTEIQLHFVETSRIALVALLVLFYGMARSITPYTGKEYLQWLESTPWTSRLPLPVCTPIKLVWQDVVVVGCGMLFWHDGAISVWYVPALFFAVRSFCRFGINAEWTFQWGFYIPAALLLAIVPVYDRPLLVLALALVSEVVTTAAMRKGMTRFPLTLPTWQLHNERIRAPHEHRSEVMTGWPWVDHELLNKNLLLTIANRDKLAWVAMLGWATFCAVYHLSLGDEKNVVCCAVIMLVGCVFGCARALFYCGGFGRPLNFWVRLIKWRWIVPGYDIVYVAPLTVFAISAVVPFGIEWATGSIKLAMVVGVMTVTWAVLCLGPSLERWRFLGHHNISGTVNHQTHMKI